MNKRNVGRLAGFVGAAGMTAALVTGGVSMTGAYFQDTESGTVTVDTGEVDIAVDDSTPLESAFTDLAPTETQTQTYTVHNVGTETVDYWLSAGGPFTGSIPAGAGCEDVVLRIRSSNFDTGLKNGCDFLTSPGVPPYKVALGVEAGQTRNIHVTVGLTAAAGNEWANQTANAELHVIATQAGQDPTTQVGFSDDEI